MSFKGIILARISNKDVQPFKVSKYEENFGMCIGSCCTDIHKL